MTFFFPRKSERWTGWPSVSGSVKSGATSPTLRCVCGALGGWEDASLLLAVELEAFAGSLCCWGECWQPCANIKTIADSASTLSFTVFFISKMVLLVSPIMKGSSIIAQALSGAFTIDCNAGRLYNLYTSLQCLCSLSVGNPASIQSDFPPL